VLLVEVVKKRWNVWCQAEPLLNAFTARRDEQVLAEARAAEAAVPCGFTKGGLPVDLQIVVRPLSEEMLVAMARPVEETLSCSKLRPPLSLPSGSSHRDR
jgi:hypothetical protein